MHAARDYVNSSCIVIRLPKHVTPILAAAIL